MIMVTNRTGANPPLDVASELKSSSKNQTAGFRRRTQKGVAFDASTPVPWLLNQSPDRAVTAELTPTVLYYRA